MGKWYAKKLAPEPIRLEAKAKLAHETAGFLVSASEEFPTSVLCVIAQNSRLSLGLVRLSSSSYSEVLASAGRH